MPFTGIWFSCPEFLVNPLAFRVASPPPQAHARHTALASHLQPEGRSSNDGGKSRSTFECSNSRALTLACYETPPTTHPVLLWVGIGCYRLVYHSLWAVNHRRFRLGGGDSEQILTSYKKNTSKRKTGVARSRVVACIMSVAWSLQAPIGCVVCHWQARQ